MVLNSCKELKIENTELCSVAGVLSAGMDCANTHNKQTREMNLSETIDWLQASDEVKDKNGKVIQPKKGAAVCQSAEHFNSFKTSLEVACKMLGSNCSYEIKEAIKGISDATNKINIKN